MKNSQTPTVESTVPTEVPLPIENPVEIPVPKVFNPIALLNESQRKALGNRFNKTWITPRISSIETLQKEHVIDFFTAAFTLSLLEDADNLIAAKKIAKTADTMYNLASELFGTKENTDAALHQIEVAYENLEVIQMPQAGKKFRQLVMKGFTSKMGVQILTLVCEKLGVRESEWI